MRFPLNTRVIIFEKFYFIRLIMPYLNSQISVLYEPDKIVLHVHSMGLSTYATLFLSQRLRSEFHIQTGHSLSSASAPNCIDLITLARVFLIYSLVSCCCIYIIIYIFVHMIKTPLNFITYLRSVFGSLIKICFVRA